MKKKNIAIILSGGTGKRFGGTLPKQFYKLGDKNILEINVEKFLNSNLFFKVIIVSHRNNIKKTQNIFRTKKNIIIVKGGESRQKSVFNGLKECKKLTPERVVIHDSARPLFSPKLLFKMFKFVKSKQAVVPIIKISDSIRNIEGLSYTDIDRSNLYRIQTPQLFDFSSIYNAHKNIKKKKIYRRFYNWV